MSITGPGLARLSAATRGAGYVPGSNAIYEKQVGATGEMLQYAKTTVDPAGNIVHVKDKITGTVVTP